MSDLVQQVQENRVIVEEPAERVAIGQWYWVIGNTDGDDPEDACEEWLGCITKIGTNFVNVTSPEFKRSQSSLRVHFNNFYKDLRFEPNHEQYIRGQQRHFQGQIEHYMGEVQRLSANLGVGNPFAIGHQKESVGTGLAVLSEQVDVKEYEKALVRLKDESLPELFEKIEESNNHLAKWLSAPSVPMKAAAKQMEGMIANVDDRIFNISLYAGLTEEVVKFASGQPAGLEEKLRVMQRRLYMDEECLIGYQHGGMDIQNIEQFDEWLAEPANRDRILPFARSMVSMRVRREVKDRDSEGRIDKMFVNVALAQSDKLTFLMIRNGENLYRMSCELDFGDMMFPERGSFDPQGEKMMKKEFGRIEFMSVAEFEQIKAEQAEDEALVEKWEKEHPYKQWKANIERLNLEAPLPRGTRSTDYYWWHSECPHRLRHRFYAGEWEKFNDDSVYYDDAVQEMTKQIKQYNRVALIIQGLFDRSECLHPHRPVKTWTQDGFDRAVHLVYDAENVLHHGDAPDFEAYRADLNASLDGNSVTVGQEDYWELKEGEKECERLDRSWRSRDSNYRPTRFRPYGNSGPGRLARVARFKAKSKEAVYRWHRERINYSHGDSDNIVATITVPAEKLFNASAYKLGDYKQFFNDPRTRADYLKWANMLLTAEEYASGRLRPSEPVSGEAGLQ